MEAANKGDCEVRETGRLVGDWDQPTPSIKASSIRASMASTCSRVSFAAADDVQELSTSSCDIVACDSEVMESMAAGLGSVGFALRRLDEQQCALEEAIREAHRKSLDEFAKLLQGLSPDAPFDGGRKNMHEHVALKMSKPAGFPSGLRESTRSSTWEGGDRIGKTCSMLSAATVRTSRPGIDTGDDFVCVRETEKRLASESAARYADQMRAARSVPTLALRARLAMLTESNTFELTFALLIIMNAVIMMVEAQYGSLTICYELGYAKCDEPGQALWPGASDTFSWIELLLGVVFTLEVCLKLISQNLKKFFMSGWNIMDMVIIAFWFLSMFSMSTFGVNPTIIRLARLARLFRFLRLVKTIQVFDVLRRLVGSLKASVGILFWSLALLLVMMASISLLMNYAVYDIIKDESLALEDRMRAYQIAGSFVRSFVSVYEITFRLNLEPCRFLFELNEYIILPVLVYEFVVAFAVMNVFQAVFLNETIKVAACDDDIMVLEMQRQHRQERLKLLSFFRIADKTGDGLMDFKEFLFVLQDEAVRTWLEAMDINLDEPRPLFQLLCSMCDKDELTCEDFVDCVCRLKGSARSLDLHNIGTRMKLLEDKILEALHASA